MNRPKLTVVVPVYNGMPYLAVAIESLLSQTLKDFVVLVVNDGSKDGSRDYLDSLKDPRLKIIHQENKGLCHTLNEAIASVETEFVARLDQDDVAMPDRLEVQLDFLKKSSSYGAVQGNIVRIAGNGKSFGSHMSLDDGVVDYDSQKYGCIVHSTLMMRTELFRSIGGYRAAMYPVDDFDLLLRLEESSRIGIISAPVVKYRIHGAAGSFATAEAMDWKTRMVLENASRRRNGETELSNEEFRDKDRHRSRWLILLAENSMRGRLLFRGAGLDLGENRPIRAVFKLVGATFLAPGYSFSRLFAMLKSKLRA